MLHGTLPRAFLTSGLNYLGGYYGEDMHPYATATYVPIEDHYSRMAEQQALTSWQSPRSITPSPLDLSLKPAPPTPTTPKTEDSETCIEVDDEEARRIREDAHRLYLRDNNDDTIHNHHDQLLFQEDIQEPCSIDLETRDKVFDPEDLRQEVACSEDADQRTNSLHKYNTRLLGLQKLQNNPTRLQLQSAQNYHQQLLLTPQHHLQDIHAPMTPPSTPSPPQCPRKRMQREDDTSLSSLSSTSTPTSRQTPSSGEKLAQAQRPKKKHARRLKFDEDTSSPVSGTVILGPDEAVVTGDIDPAFNIVEVTDEARAELAKIENRLGPYQCKLCRQLHEDAFQLAQHRCSRIAHVEYRCPECDKRFSCPANLASHRRWHKPRLPNGESAGNSTTLAAEVPCTRCDAKFTRQAALRKHLASQHPDTSCDTNDDVVADGSKVPNGANVHHVGRDLVGTEMP